MSAFLSTSFGLAGAALSALISVPQAVRSVRHGSAGVSSLTFQLITALGLTWTAYAVSQGLWLLCAGNAVLAISSLVVLWALHRDGAPVRRLTSIMVPVTLVALIVGTIDPTWLGWLAGVISVASRFPQMSLVRFSKSIHGVSIHTWVLNAVCSACWLGYGILNDDLRLIVVCPINIATSAGLVGGVFFRRRRETLKT